MVSDFISTYKSSDRAKLASFLPPSMVAKSCSCFIPSHPQQDSLVWGLTADGEYSVKSGARLAQGLLNENVVPVDYALDLET